MSAYALPNTAARPALAPKTTYLITSGDLRESANIAGWETQKNVEAGVTAAVEALGWNVVRGFDVDPAHRPRLHLEPAHGPRGLQEHPR